MDDMTRLLLLLAAAAPAEADGLLTVGARVIFRHPWRAEERHEGLVAKSRITGDLQAT
jgi:hypothetical protein